MTFEVANVGGATADAIAIVRSTIRPLLRLGGTRALGERGIRVLSHRALSADSGYATTDNTAEELLIPTREYGRR